jgi:CheY-like chemotaxis protein
MPALLESMSLETPDQLVNEVGDDRDYIESGDKVLLIIENDLGFARFLLDTARDKGFKGIVTSLGTAALSLTASHKPHAITLDIYLPDIEGWRVLDRLKNDLATRHIPVCVISTDDSRDRALSSGAFAFVTKPIPSRDLLDELFNSVGEFITRRTRKILVVADPGRSREIETAIEAEDVEVTTAHEVAGALEMLTTRSFDCVLIGSGGRDLAAKLVAEQALRTPSLGRLPVIIYPEGGSLDHEEVAWKRPTDKVTVQSVHSPDRLLDLVTFFLHQPVARLADKKRQCLLDLHQSDKLLAGKKVLVVDDDMRNIFALTSILEEHLMVAVSADNGRDAIKLLQEEPDVDIVLMDIMMPEMDGMETMREIRKIPKLRNLPIVAVTAKAMKGDREKCIEAGAWDYLAKPVDPEQMLASLRGWLHR